MSFSDRLLMTQHSRSTLDLMVREIEAIPEEHWEELLVALRKFWASARYVNDASCF